MCTDPSGELVKLRVTIAVVTHGQTLSNYVLDSHLLKQPLSVTF